MNYIEQMQSDLTQEEAIALSKSGWWLTMTPRQAALLQLKQERLCISTFSTFHGLVETALGRSVYTHQFANPQRLIQLLEGVE